MSPKKEPLNWRILLKVFSFAKPHWLWLTLSLANSVKGVAMQFVTPYLIQVLTDSVVAQRTEDLMRGLLFASITILLDVALTLFGRRAATRYISYSIRDLRDRVTAHVQQLPMAFLDTCVQPLLFAANTVNKILVVSRQVDGTFLLGNQLHSRAKQFPTRCVSDDQNTVGAVERRTVFVVFLDIR